MAVSYYFFLPNISIRMKYAKKSPLAEELEMNGCFSQYSVFLSTNTQIRMNTIKEET